jgi:general secretion pathway protein H
VCFPDSRFPIVDSRRSTGFTLIELLVVLVIAAVLAAALVVAVAGSSERRLANAAEQFGALLGQACSEAELTGREIGLSVAADGYAFSRLDADAWRAFGRDGALRARAWPAGLRFELSRAGRPLQPATAGHDAPQIVCFSSGELTPFALELSLGDAPAYRVEGTDDGRVETRRAEARR